ncbi:MAG: hypothetical protein II483_08160 [Lachnospiraceae bacterium]|nr:hypothetical protein [Lachnospiraceae bacterium]
MIGLLYLAECLLTGFAIVIAILPRVMQRKILTVAGERTRNPFFALYPASLIAGILTQGWLTYAVARLFARTEKPLTYANLIVMTVLPVASVLVILRFRNHVKFKPLLKQLRPTASEMLYLAASISFASVMMIASFRVISGQMILGSPVAEDFSLHVNLIRSVSEWQSVPVQYPLFTGAGMRYHFFFDFFAGNLEFLGMRIDLAYNVPSVLAMLAMYCAIFECFFRLCGRKNVCHLVWLFVTFRSSLGIYRFVRENAGNLSRALRTNEQYLGKTDYEWWGLYGVNTLVNQRHLIFGMAVAFFVISLFLPYVIKGAEERAEIRKTAKGKEYLVAVFKKHMTITGRSQAGTAVYAGIFLGLTGYVSGHAVIAALLILFVLMWFSREQLAFAFSGLCAAFITVLLITAFAGSGSPFGTELTYGYVLENRSVVGVAKFFWEWLGLLLPLLILYAVRGGKAQRVFLAASILPIVFGFCVKLSPNMIQNHKYLFFSLYLLEMQGAIAFADAIRVKKANVLTAVRIACMLLLLVPLLGTGLYDSYLTLKKCDSKKSYTLDVTPGLLTWAKEAGVTKDTVFLCAGNVLTNVNAAGFQNYYGHISMARGAGYDVDARKPYVDALMHAPDAESAKKAAADAGISYVIIQRRQRNDDPELREDVLSACFSKVYSLGSDVYEIAVYDTGFRTDSQAEK